MSSAQQESSNGSQLMLDMQHAVSEDPDYLTQQLITYIGNKRSLLGHITSAVETVKARLGKDRLRVLDAFAGSGVVSRCLKAHASYLVSNDIEAYAALIARCYLGNRSSVDMAALKDAVRFLRERAEDPAFEQGFIEDLYAPADEDSITEEDRVFYTRRNARRLDNCRRALDELDAEYFDLLLGPLLSEASIHANTAGVFKGFYKCNETKVGKFGGTNEDALKRIKGLIMPQLPVLSRFECDHEVRQEDANQVVREVTDLDLVYLDPPYNQHPYGSNYFMLNLLVDYERPTEISRVAGIPTDWQRSDYNVKRKCFSRFRDLVEVANASHILVSFNDEGFIPPERMNRLLSEIGRVEVVQIPYNAFRGSRNFRNRSIHVTEHLFLVERD